MDIELLRTFRDVARQGSITGAGQALGYTQSGVSRQIAGLEQALGVRLFDRVARGVRLTEHGRTILPHAEAILARFDDARRELEAVERLERGRIRVGAFPTAVAALLPRAMAAFRRAHPGISLSLVEGTSRRQFARLDAGEADLAVVSAFGGRPLDRDRFDFVHLLDDVMLVALPCAHRLAGRKRVRLSELVGESWIGAEAGDDEGILGPPRPPGRETLPADFVVREWTAKLGLVAAGLGVTVVPSLAALAARGDIALVRLSRAEAPPRRVYAATAKDATRTPATDAFIEVLRRIARA